MTNILCFVDYLLIFISVTRDLISKSQNIIREIMLLIRVTQKCVFSLLLEEIKGLFD